MGVSGWTTTATSMLWVCATRVAQMPSSRQASPKLMDAILRLRFMMLCLKSECRSGRTPH